ncbi:MAG: cation:proton antiporter [Methanobacteriota archaeon]|nr:MAG: cation:proton antiporter [Euryarchaeota archaeon]
MALLELIALFAVARVLGEACERVHVPALIGEIAAGVALGPLLLNWITPTDSVKLVADLGVFFIVYAAGMEMTFRGVRRIVKESGAAVAAGSFSLPFLLGFLVALAFGYDAQVSLFLGLALSLTALPVSVRILTDMGWVHTDVGQTIITAGLLCDIAGLTVLAVITNWGALTGGDVGLTGRVVLQIVLFFLIVFTVEHVLAAREGFLAKRLVAGSQRLLSRGAAFSVPLLLVFAFSLLAQGLGLHFVVGTFFGSVIIAEHVFPPHEGERLRTSIGAISDGFLAPIFFAYLGLVAVQFDPSLAALFAVLLLAAVAGKVAGSYVGARLGGFQSWSASLIAVGMNGRGAMELVIALVGLELGIIGGSVFSLLVIMGLITTFMTPFALRRLAKIPRPRSETGPEPGP